METTQNPMHKIARHGIAIAMGLAILGADYIYFKGTPFFGPIIIIAFTVAWSQFWLDFFMRKQREKEIENKFPEFVRNLVGAVKSGMPITTAVSHVSRVDYGALTPYVRKLANKVEWSIPVHKALMSFANETKSKIIKRAVTTVIEAEQSGGNIEDVLESMTESLISIKKMKEKRKASIQGQMMQSYTIFFVFLGIMIVVQNFLIPYLMNVQKSQWDTTEGAISGDTSTDMEDLAQTQLFSESAKQVTINFSSVQSFFDSVSKWFMSFNGVFLMLSLIQGLFAGLVIGKLSEGDMGVGMKHSLVLMTIAFLVISFSRGLVK